MTQSPKIEKSKRNEKLSDKEQSERFIEAARELGADNNPEKFDEAIAALLTKKPS